MYVLSENQTLILTWLALDLLIWQWLQDTVRYSAPYLNRKGDTEDAAGKSQRQDSTDRSAPIFSVHLCSPDTILQLIVIGWKDFPGDSDGLGTCPCGMILQLAVIGWNAEFPWDPRVILSDLLDWDEVRSEHEVRTDSLLTVTLGTKAKEKGIYDYNQYV